ncbi:synaptic vesicle membrane protein VAT-1 homolog isoform X1 [Macrosteles quadrilineatus]|uniref:synaptic vesicle membrane protein VAT-1 homolog isoform X1 n=1 Tax=Macrosteles quadrilineatus TaxID=74068 RepID=UPI0023E1300E|nr:synaptic vesicle membrane protein VAT-1 homolog isoform X1 [Macrosteles quadrilineatus]
MEVLRKTSTEPDSGTEVKVRSIVLTEHGSFDHIKVMEWPLPSRCGPLQVRVAVSFCGVNFADVYHVQGRLLQTAVPYVMGLECAGKVLEIGTCVNHIDVGDRVVCYMPESGCFQETVIVPSSQCFLIPEDISTDIACCLPANYLTAYFALCELGNLRPGNSVLIHSAAGGVGWAATQLANLAAYDVKVYGIASESKHDEIIKNGVLVALTHDNFSSRLNKPEFDIIIDNVGGVSTKRSMALLKPLGRIILTGANSVIQDNEAKVTEALFALSSSVVPMQELVAGNKAVCGLHMGTLLQEAPSLVNDAMRHIFKLCQEGKIKPKIYAVHPFSQASAAIKTLASRKNIGKVLLDLN